jgi:23S rRNA A2030 N6-methylase RlmJ
MGESAAVDEKKQVDVQPPFLKAPEHEKGSATMKNLDMRKKRVQTIFTPAWLPIRNGTAVPIFSRNRNKSTQCDATNIFELLVRLTSDGPRFEQLSGFYFPSGRIPPCAFPIRYAAVVAANGTQPVQLVPARMKL